MTNIYIDFSKTSPVFGNTFAGHVGEHNATNLIITPPKYMSEDNRIINYTVAFETEEGKRYKSDIYTKNTTVETPLYSQLTTGDILYIQLEGYGEDNNVIIKSDVVFIRIGSSLGDSSSTIDSSAKPQENVIQFGWIPENKDVLEGFGSEILNSNTILTYDGQALNRLPQFKTTGHFMSTNFNFTNDFLNTPSRYDNKLYLYCYDIPYSLLVTDIIVKYIPDGDTDYTELRFSDLKNIGDPPRIQVTPGNMGNAYRYYIRTSDIDKTFDSYSYSGSIKHLCEFLDCINIGNPVIVILEYIIPYAN